ncbi:hypothetical protein B5P22_30705 [Pseudomonas tolaasii]|uniref:hypothetical protein n=1 Tax=Pseudomonas tolaasii TaxID=29442 RepID=UPI0009B626A0|nr:hypothetical protein [Pseudomonas tolaasii]ARB31481.1 hypothetical protein B5P22_30705 [Pseudomonas tolaasii]
MIDFKAVQKLRVQDGDLLVVPESTEQDDMQLLAESIQIMSCGERACPALGRTAYEIIAGDWSSATAIAGKPGSHMRGNAAWDAPRPASPSEERRVGKECLCLCRHTRS